MITLLTKPYCTACKATYKALDSRLVQYKTVDLTQDPDALEDAKALGYLQAPVILVHRDGELVDHWSGFRPDKIIEWF